MLYDKKMPSLRDKIEDKALEEEKTGKKAELKVEKTNKSKKSKKK